MSRHQTEDEEADEVGQQQGNLDTDTTTYDIYLQHMLMVVASQSLVTFVFFCMVLDVVIQDRSVASLVCAIVLCVFGGLHTAWALHRFPHFCLHTPHTARVATYHPTAHPDYLHPENATVYQKRLMMLRVRQSELAEAEAAAMATIDTQPSSSSSNENDTSLSTSASSVSFPVGALPTSTFAREPIHIDGLELFQTTHIAAMPQTSQHAFLSLLMTSSDVSAMRDTDGYDANDDSPSLLSVVCGWFICGKKIRHIIRRTNGSVYALRSVTDAEAHQWMYNYVHKNSCLFLVGSAVDVLLGYSGALLVIAAIANVLRLYGAWMVCAPRKSDFLARTSDDIAIESHWHSATPLARHVLLFLCACTIAASFLPDPPHVALVTALAAAVFLLGRSTHPVVLCVWLVAFVIVTSVRDDTSFVTRISLSAAWTTITIVVVGMYSYYEH